jgi:hypothetical protein
MRKKLIEFLQATGKVSPRQFEDARRTQRFFGGSVLHNLVRLGVLKESEAEDLFSRWAGYPYAPTQELKKIPAAILTILEPVIAGRRRLVPFRKEDDGLYLATSRVDNDPFFRDLERRLGVPVIPYAILEERLEELLERHYGIPAPRRDEVRPVDFEDPLAKEMGEESPARDAKTVRGAQVGLDGLPLDSEVAAQDLFATLGPARAPAIAASDTDRPPSHRPPSHRPPSPPAVSPDLEDTAPFSVSATADATTQRSTPADQDTAATGQAAAGIAPQPPAPEPFEGAPLERLSLALSRDEIGRAAVELATSSGLARVALFGIQKERLVGWDAAGAGVDPERVRRLSIPLYTPSIFASLRLTPAPYVGIVPDQPANQELLTALGGEPPRIATAFPVVVKRRTVAVLYADDGPGGRQAASMTELERLAFRLALALEILLLRKKIVS